MSAPGESEEGGHRADAGYSDLRQLTTVSPRELLAIHGVGPKAIRILREALAANGLAFRRE